jgi:hypothetical protein
MPTRIAHKTCACCHAPWNTGSCIVGYACSCSLSICYRCCKCARCCQCAEGPEPFASFDARMRRKIEQRRIYPW